MIYETKEISSELLSGLKPNNYTRRIKSHFAAYGTGYDFLHFYAGRRRLKDYSGYYSR
jgi:hypothetical protein